jgi:phospholipid/cholesterol/gamma-HCH transport system substrate-binding protein
VGLNRSWVETLIGAVVIVVAVGFVALAFSRSDIRPVNGYEVIAKFDRVDGLRKGSDVTMSGIKIGTVIDQSLDPKTFRAVVRIAIAGDVKLPKDTGARIVSESLLGNQILSLEPGGDDENIKPGGEIGKTQGSVNLIDLIGRMMMSVGKADEPKK